MKHLGDISRISGYDAPVVDCIIGGSPCQDLSVAGKRAGLAGERSGLFMEQIRIIKEMRDADRKRGRTGQFVRPRYGIWENVPGALSSPGKEHTGEDFAAVLEEFVRVAEPEAPPVSVPDKGWPTSGCLYGMDGRWSVAWRILDAQFWGATLTSDDRVLRLGTPQRRRRIALVADFGGCTAPEILFERTGLSGDPEPLGETGEGAAAGAGDGAGAADPAVADPGAAGELDLLTAGPSYSISAKQQSLAVGEEIAAVLGAEDYKEPQVVVCPAAQAAGFGYKQSAEAGGIGFAPEVAPTLRGGRHDAAYIAAVTYDARGNGDGRICATLTGDHQGRVTDYTSLVCYGIGNGQVNQGLECEKVGTMNCMHDQQAVLVPVAGVDCRNFAESPELYPTLQAKSDGGHSLNYSGAVRIEYIVRRLMPLECERLQNFPDNWTKLPQIETMSEEDFIFFDGVRREAARVFGKSYRTPTVEGMVKWYNKMAEADSHRYQSLGNSICLPMWKWIVKRLCSHYERDVTMGSLFDGIGGFPLIWEQINGRGMCLWASEVEPFQIAVTRLHFGKEG